MKKGTFKKGDNRINRGGRPKGSKNKTPEQIRQVLLDILAANLKRFQVDIESLEPKERASVLISLAKHCTPPAINPESLTESQLQQIIEYMKRTETLNTEP
jgi:hypothetical protein